MTATATRIRTAVEALAGHNITFVTDSSTITRDDAWTAAERKHGRRIAVLYLDEISWAGGEPCRYLGGERHMLTALFVDHPYKDRTVGPLVADALREAGLKVAWDGDNEAAIRIDLAA